MTNSVPGEGTSGGRRDDEPQSRGQEGHETAQESIHHHACKSVREQRAGGGGEGEAREHMEHVTERMKFYGEMRGIIKPGTTSTNFDANGRDDPSHPGSRSQRRMGIKGQQYK